MSDRREPNRQLQELLTEARYSRKGFARRVNELAAAQGVRMSCDHTSVARWLAGAVPREPTPALLAQVLSQGAGRTVTARDLGMSAGSEDRHIGLRYPKTLESAVDTVTRLWRYDVERRDFLVDAPFAVGAASASSRDWLIGMPKTDLSFSGGSSRVHMRDVRAARVLGDEFERLSHEYGSQRIRRHMVNYLRYDIEPLFKKSRTEEVGRALLQTAAEFTASAGYMAVDCNKLDLAERYYIQALAMADAAGPRHYGAQVMATHLGHLMLYAQQPAEAVRLAEAARAGSRRDGGGPLALAVAWVVEARGHARLGDERACARALSEAERYFCRSNASDNSPAYLRYFKEAYLADAFAHCFRDLNQPAKACDYASAAIKGMPATHMRRRSINTGILAHASLSDDEPEAAAQYAIEAVQLTRQLHSPRAFRRIARLRRRFVPYAKLPRVSVFLGQADDLLTSAAV